MRRSDKISFIVFGIGLCALFAGLAIAGRVDAQPDTLEDLCLAEATGGPRSIDLETEPAPYRGPGPHPVVLEPNPAGVPAAWRSEDESSVELVACSYSQTTGQRLKPCDYSGGVRRWLVRTRYTVHLYEARTSEKVARLRVGDSAECPYSIFETYTPGRERADGETDVGSSMDYEALADTLRPYVERTVPE